jgi:hypothetical protein
MVARREWHQLSRPARDRAARQAASDYGLTRRQARERYNRGTYKPFARDPVNRIPRTSPRRPTTPEFTEDLKERAIANLDRTIGDRFGSIRFKYVDTVENHSSQDALVWLAGATEDEIETYASYQDDGRQTPKFIRDLGWTDNDGKWHNIFWYH